MSYPIFKEIVGLKGNDTNDSKRRSLFMKEHDKISIKKLSRVGVSLSLVRVSSSHRLHPAWVSLFGYLSFSLGLGYGQTIVLQYGTGCARWIAELATYQGRGR